MKLATKTVLVLSTLMAAASAMAQSQAPAPDSSWSYNVGAVSEYRVRGIAQTSFGPAIQAGADFAHKSGLYLGVWASNISWIKDYANASGGSYEVDLYGGYKGAINQDLSYDVGVITYRYPGNTLKAITTANADTIEVYAALSYGVATLKYNRSTGNLLGNPNSSGSQYFDLSATFDLGNGYTLTPHLGRQSVPNQSNANRTGNAANYTDYALTLAKDFGNGLVGSVAAIGTGGTADRIFYTGADGKFIARDALVLGLKYSF